MRKILFVCTANRCRSPMAERLFIKILQSQGQPPGDWLVTSAGVWAEDGFPPDDNLVFAMAAFGIDITDHRSRMIDAGIISDQDLVLVMEDHHKEALCFEFPDHRDRVFMLSEMIGQHFDINDPFGGPLKAYQRTAEQLNEILTQGFEKIVQLTLNKRQ
jgi:protein-tyrosine phosphatase